MNKVLPIYLKAGRRSMNSRNSLIFAFPPILLISSIKVLPNPHLLRGWAKVYMFDLLSFVIYDKLLYCLSKYCILKAYIILLL